MAIATAPLEMEWHGTINAVHAGLSDTLLAANWHNKATDSSDPAFWHTGRLARGIIDTYPHDEAYVDLIGSMCTFASAYETGTATAWHWQSLQALTSMSGSQDIPVSEHFDATQYGAITSGESYVVGADLASAIGAPALFLPLCHGGFIPGVQASTAYARAANEDGTILYPVRFSKYKHREQRPYLSTYELSHIQSLAANRAVIVYDGVVASSATMRAALDFFSGTLKGHARLYGASAIDWRSAEQVASDGTYWEHAT